MPLPFVINQDSTYTIDDDYDVQVKGSSKGDLKKNNLQCIYFVMLVLVKIEVDIQF